MMLPGDLEAEDRINNPIISVVLTAFGAEQLFPFQVVESDLTLRTDDIRSVEMTDSGKFHM